jgi:hypothetical protein
MPCRWRELALVATCLGPAPRLSAQQIRELGVQATGTFSDPALAVAGVYGALRTLGRTRISVSVSAGGSGGDAVIRGEVLAHFLLSPEKLRGAGFYLAGGIAGVEGRTGRGFLVLTAGLEQRPGRRSGWALEAGFGGGARIALGYRWRWLPRPAFQ